MEDLKVGSRIDSDHLPVTFKIKRDVQNREKQGDKTPEVAVEKLKWDNRSDVEYKEAMRNLEEEVTQEESIENRWKLIKKSIWETGRRLNENRKKLYENV